MWSLVLVVLGGPVASAKRPAAPPAVESTAALNGRTYVIELVDPMTAEKQADSPAFISGRLYAPGRDFYGFTAADYLATEQGGVFRFTCTMTSATHGTLLWEGTVKGDVIEGTTTWTRPDQPVAVWPFVGTRLIVDR